ncbi:MAG: hypothetical protein KJO54_01915 [Gammaproteobacteria bacterium]|nr:hypothetical protein [Gammaproteobacteria bacterium]NNF59952.1 hypothetical protein [Gammaproteobacteria bacterium]NNM19684.1 hypothetical protein [Gammaproteobacteria bacterium]
MTEPATEAAAMAPGYFGSDAGCMEGPLVQFGQYIGQWKIEDSSLARDGSGWTNGQGAQWDFVCVGGGTAVQDFWMPNEGPVGTNLRTYNPETESWDIVWTIKGLVGQAHINAKQQANGNLLMTYVSPAQNPPRRITFFPATEDSWNWMMEFSFDGGESYIEVYRIKATRIR